MTRRVLVALSTLFILISGYLCVRYLIIGDHSRWQVALGGMIVSALPLFLLKTKKIPIPTSAIVGFYVTILCTTFLGSISQFYIKYSWWDSSVHLYKGLYMGLIAISIYKLFIKKEIRANISKWFLFLFALTLSVTFSVLWEIYEFVGDLTFTHTMQLGGNKDTMLDLIFASLGAILAAFYSLFRLDSSV